MTEMTDWLTHLGADGRAVMVDISEKAITRRRARAAGAIRMGLESLEAVKKGDAPKGDVVGTARLAGIMAAKKTHELIPLCHPLALTDISVEITLDPDLPGLRVVAEAAVDGKTGVEMEALTAVSVAVLTIYDMVKAIDRTMEIGDIRVIEKTGGRTNLSAKSGTDDVR